MKTIRERDVHGFDTRIVEEFIVRAISLGTCRGKFVFVDLGLGFGFGACGDAYEDCTWMGLDWVDNCRIIYGGLY